MKQAQLSRSGTLKMLAALAALAILTALASCTMVGDTLNGVRLKVDGPTSCVKECNDRYKILYDEEQKTHDSNIESCQTLDQPDRTTCLEAESARHEAVKAELSAGKIECQDNCHRQGSGTAS